LDPAEDALADTYDIVGLDLATNTPIVVSSAPGNQTGQAISGSVAVWQDNAHSCPTCEHDIRGKDLATGVTFDIATGSADQSHPAIHGKTVAWVQFDGITHRILTKDLDTGSTSQITATGSDTGITFDTPAISAEYIVWSEISPQRLDRKPVASRIKAYNRNSGAVKQVAEFYGLVTQYALGDHRLVWNDPQLRMADLNTGETSLLYAGWSTSPAINGDVVTWSTRSTMGADDFDIWGLNLKDRKALPLVTGAGNQLGSTIVGNLLVWRNEGGTDADRVTRTSLSDAFATAPERQKALEERQQAESTQAATLAGEASPDAPSYTRPEYKGMHAANGDGWNGSSAAVDALGAAQGAPYFGSVLVLDSDLTRPTGRSSPWGPEVRHAMQTLQATHGVRVILRTWPTLAINTSGTTTPDHVAQQVLNNAWRSWLRHVQINNEPNIEWPYSCYGCNYYGRYYNWDNPFDYRLYQAINDFYTDAWWSINYYKTNHPDPTIRYNLTYNITIWSPPLSEIYAHVGPNRDQTYYAYVENMIYTYNRFSYHMYSVPNYEGNGYGINNSSWRWFTARMQNDISNWWLRSQITEMGWTVDQMSMCGYSQDTTWPAGWYTGGCVSNDGASHRFEDDVYRFLTTVQRRNAEAVTVWLVRGGPGTDISDGIDVYGNERTWFDRYQNSSP
jgi:hypothetical protein